jgi:hypothetical protein
MILAFKAETAMQDVIKLRSRARPVPSNQQMQGVVEIV